MSGTQLRLLGTVEASNSDGPVDLGGARPIRVLLALFAAENRSLDLDDLAERCFDHEDRPADPIPALRTAIRRLRRALGDASIKTRTGGYELDLADVDLDIDRFEQRLKAGRAAADPVAAVTQFRHALDEWRGVPFGSHGDVEWLDSERHRLEESHLVALEGWHDAHLRNGTATEILPTLEATAKAHPLRERFHRQLMRALYLGDRPADALRAFQKHRDALIDAGLEPSAATVDLEQQIVLADPSLKVTDQGRALRGYRLLERLGEGAFSVVYRGTQPSVERDVAIKQIRAELANRPEFIRRFEAEAHMVARLEHPYIVPLYDYWREPGSAYLVMRMLRGGNLESAILDGRLSVEQTRRVVQQVGAALSVAHRAGVVHRDVKPANILLDDDGNAYLSDFGIALEEWDRLDPEAALSAGSPAYASPEQLRRQPVGPEADVHGLGIAVFEALTGRLPFPDEPDQASMLQRQLHDPIPAARNARAELPPDVDAVLQRATAKQAGDRYQSVDEFVEAFEAAFAHGPTQPARRGSSTRISTEERNPYKGLRAFTEADAADFAGRARLADQLVDAVREHRLVAVVGPSGSGKSSVVRAGLLPALRQGAVLGSDNWFVATVLPGAHPHEELEAALVRISTDPVAGLLDVLRDGERGLSRALRQSLPENGEVLLVIDQFEEIFTLCDNEATRRQFLDALAAAVSEERSRLRVVLTLRADFYDRPLRYESVGRLVRDATVPVLPLAADELERAIVEPAYSVGCQLEPGLVSEIVADVSDQPGALPMLQYALTELYERRVSGMLTVSAYRELGGVTGALAVRADELYSESSEDEKEELRRLFARLVTFGEGTEDTRRRVLRTELGDGVRDSVIDRFGDARLLSFDRDPMTREPTVEVAHEALIREWPRLRAWIDDDRDGLRIHRHLTETARAWEASGRDDGELYRSGRLEAAEVWASDNAHDLNPAENSFLQASIERRAAEQQIEARTTQRLRRLLVGVGTIALVALLAGGLAFQQRGRANDKAAEADTERIAAEAVSFAGEDFPLSLLLAVETHHRDPGPTGLGALQVALSRSAAFLGFIQTEGAEGVHWIDEEKLLTTGSQGVALVSWRTSDVRELVETPVYQRLHIVGDGNTRLVTMADASTDAVAFARADTPEIVEVWSVAGQQLSSIEVTSAVDAIEVTNDGIVVVLDYDGWLIASRINGDELWRVHAHPESAAEDFVVPPDTFGLLYDVPLPQLTGFDPDRRPQVMDVVPESTTIITNESIILRKWSLQTGELIDDVASTPTARSGNRVTSPFDNIAVASDGDRYVGVLRHLIMSGSLLDPASAVINPVESSTAYYGNPKPDDVILTDGGKAWALFSDGRLVLINAETGAVEGELETGLAQPTHFAASGDQRFVAVASPDGLGVFSLAGDGLVTRGVPRQGTHNAGMLPEGVLVTNYSLWVPDGWKPGSWWSLNENPPRQIEAPTDGPGEFGTGFQAVGMRDYIGGMSSTFQATLRDIRTHEFIVELDMPGSWTGQVIRGDLGFGAFGTAPGVTVYELPAGDIVTVLEEPGPYVPSVTSSVDGRFLLAVGLDGKPYLYDTGDWSLLQPTELTNISSLRSARFGPRGESLFTIMNSGDLVIRDAETFEVQRQLSGGGRPLVADAEAMFFDDSGRYVLASGDGSAILVDLQDEAIVGAPFPNDSDFRIGGLDGFELVTALDDAIQVWNLDFDTWPAIACRAAGRNLTLAEWEQFGPAGEPYRSTCPQWPAAS